MKKYTYFLLLNKVEGGEGIADKSLGDNKTLDCVNET